MRETIDRVLAKLREIFARMSRRSKIQLAILAVVVIGISITLAAVLNRTTWELLATNEDGQVIVALDDMGVPYQVDGNRILVPQEIRDETAQRLRGQGVLGIAEFNYDLFDQAAGFGVSSDHAKRVYDLNLGEMISTQLMQNPKIQNALVIVNSGESSPFRIQTNTRKPSASIQLTLLGPDGLTNAEAQAIGNTVKGAVPGIEYEDIYITDNSFRSYTVGDASQSLEVELNERIALENRLREQWKMQTEQLLTPIYGMSNLQIQAYVDLNFDDVYIDQVEFFPPIAGEMDGIVRSSENIWENSRRYADAEGIPGTDSNAMGAVEYPYGTLDDLDEYRRRVESLNYEINETRTLIQREKGYVQNSSITVLINSTYLGEEEAPEEYTEEVIDMVSKATGINPANVSVSHLPFNIDTTWEDEYRAAQEARAAQERMQWIIEQALTYGTILALAIMVIMLIRTMIKAFRPPPEPEEVLVADGPGIGMDFLISDAIDAEGAGEKSLEEIDIGAKSAGLEQIERFIDKDAASVAQLLRNWLSDE